MPVASEVLKHYIAICKNEKTPYFMLLRKISCKPRDGIKEMWKEHTKAIAVFRKEKKRNFKGLREKKDADYSLLDLKYDIAKELLKCCVFCERQCRVNRTEEQKGWCRVGVQSHVATMFEHWGEESCLVPSGTVFFAGCTWGCVYCQNWDISQFPEHGIPMRGEEIADWIDREAKEGRIINANFVGGEPTPNLHTIIDTARHMKTPTPLIWNSNMYMSEEVIALHEGVVDVYLADFRYGNNECAMRLSSVPRYMETITRNFKLAARQAEMIVRILVLPNHVECCAKNILDWIGRNIGNKVYVNLMSQYRPEYKAREYPEIARKLHIEEYKKAIEYLNKADIKYYEIQGI